MEEGDHLPFYLETREPGANDGDDEPLTGEAIPAATAFLGLSFIACALMVAGLPPLSGFLAKFAMLTALLAPVDAQAAESAIAPVRSALFVLLLASGLLSMIALSRAGVRHFWAPQGRAAPRSARHRVRAGRGAAAAVRVLAVRADPVLRYARAAARDVMQPARLHRCRAVGHADARARPHPAGFARHGRP